MGVSIVSIGIQRSARRAFECLAVYFFSNYYVRVVFKVVDDEVPPELSDLFIDDGACLKGVYVRAYERQSK